MRERRLRRPVVSRAKFLFVEGADQTAIEDGGWLLGLVHGLAANLTSLVVIDAAPPRIRRSQP